MGLLDTENPEQIDVKRLEFLAQICTCEHSGFAHLHLNLPNVPQQTPTYCGYPVLGGESCQCERFAPVEKK